jgi:uncharacterized protein DUF4351
MRPALQQTVEEWNQEWIREGMAGMLVRLVDVKFGPLRPEDRTRIESADAEQLLQWTDRILDASSLAEMLAG